ncbi:uncharacterized protein LOC131587867 [Poecile atricapillus]|uniref:uncharacterized protein LOC131587867 n=1 Tax=Poecile atricapillus TaxID=48891 RepID=UPI0027384140|nr:uncharacterized protein LOC131587867 [Poecile atricapillus]
MEPFPHKGAVWVAFRNGPRGCRAPCDDGVRLPAWPKRAASGRGRSQETLTQKTAAWQWQELPRWRGALPWRSTWILPAGHPRAKSKAMNCRGAESGVPGRDSGSGIFKSALGMGRSRLWPLRPREGRASLLFTVLRCAGQSSPGACSITCPSCLLCLLCLSCCMCLALFLLGAYRKPRRRSYHLRSLGSSARCHRSFASGARRGLGIASVLESIRSDVF